MRILYGVQATGQGHISRARAMANAFQALDVEVTWLFSGRARETLFDMQPFRHYKHRRGLTFATSSGRVLKRQTLRVNKVFKFLSDVRHLSLDPYDCVVTDFEPIVAWAARRAGRECVGIGHQYAFGPGTPVAGDTALTRFIMREFAPVSHPVGLHWHPYADNVLPPILDLPPIPNTIEGHVLVYLPFEDQGEVTRLLQSVSGRRFVQYGGNRQASLLGNVVCKPASISTFKQDLASAAGVICNSGFELISECMHWQKPVLTKPLSGQMEQLSNALALQQLGLARVVEQLNQQVVLEWLQRPKCPVPARFPDVARTLASWLARGRPESINLLSKTLWLQSGGAPTLAPTPQRAA